VNFHPLKRGETIGTGIFEKEGAHWGTYRPKEKPLGKKSSNKEKPLSLGRGGPNGPQKKALILSPTLFS